MLKGRLGLDDARIAHADRHGLVWLSRGALSSEDGGLRFVCAGGASMPSGRYDVPVQGVSLILLGPGSTVSHDAMRLLSNYGTGLAAVGEDGVRLYSALLPGRDESELARRQARVWSDEYSRTMIARRLFAWRFGEVLPHDDLDVLRGIEGDRMKAAYARIAAEYGVKWNGRRYDRANPTGADIPNQAINHAASAVEAIAAIAVNAVSAIPQLGFIHEHSAQAFVLDIADLFRNELTLPIAFAAALEMAKGSQYSIDRIVRYRAGRMFREKNVAGLMIEKIKELFDVGYDGGHNAGRSRQVPRVSADDLRRDSAGSVHRAADIPGGQKQDMEGDGGVA